MGKHTGLLSVGVVGVGLVDHFPNILKYLSIGGKRLVVFCLFLGVANQLAQVAAVSLRVLFNKGINALVTLFDYRITPFFHALELCVVDVVFM